MTEPCIDVAEDQGAIRVLLVDEAIRPVAEVVVTVGTGDASVSQTTDEDGKALFTGLDPGSYVVQASHFLYKDAQATAEVVAGDRDPPITKILLERLFSQDPYSQPLKFEGFIQCGYSISGVMSSLCLNDYTHFVGPYTCVDCEHILDKRSTDFAIDAGWQSVVFEMTWDPTTQGTSDQMGLIVSFFPRDASHAYCNHASDAPLYLRMDLNVTCEGQQSEPELVPPEGMPNMHMFAATAARDQPASVIVSQGFTVYSHIFYYGKPPEGWSFVAGDQPPF